MKRKSFNLHSRRIAQLLILLSVSLILLSVIKTSRNTPPIPVFNGVVPVNAAQTITAGEPTIIRVGPVAVRDGTMGTLIAEGSYGVRIYQSVFHQREAHFILSGKETQQSGMVLLTAIVGKGQGRAHILIQASAPIEPLTPLVGAKAIIADANHWSMTVLIPFDVYGNPVMEGTKLEVLVLHPDNRLEKKFLVIHNLLAWTRVFSGVKAGRTSIVALIGQIHGSESTLLEVAGWPVPFDIFANPQPLPADGNLVTTLSTAIILDKFGNVMPDGTLITFIVHAPDGAYSTVPAYTIDGIAKTLLQAPIEPGMYTVQATMLGVASHKIVVQFDAGPSDNRFAIAAQKDVKGNAYLLRAGPILGSLGQYIPDGTPIRFIVVNANGQQQELDSISDAGYANVELLSAQFPVGKYTVHIFVGSQQVTHTFILR